MLLITLFFCGCEKNVTVNVPAKTPKLIINAFGEWEGISNPYFQFFGVGKSKGILDTNQRNIQPWQNEFYVRNATFFLYANGILIDTLTYDSARGYQQKRFLNTKISNYAIKGSASGFLDIEATSAVPEYIPVKIASYQKNIRKNVNGFFLDEVTVSINDPSNGKNFYVIYFMRAFQSGGWSKIDCFYSKDRDIDEIGEDFDPFDTEPCWQSAILTDNNFNGTEKLIKFEILSNDMNTFTDPQTGTISHPKVILQHITEDNYKYIKSSRKYNDARDNPFAEPVNIYTNIKNGYGIFTFKTTSSQEIK